jgi:hypothetical protein
VIEIINLIKKFGDLVAVNDHAQNSRRFDETNFRLHACLRI